MFRVALHKFCGESKLAKTLDCFIPQPVIAQTAGGNSAIPE